MNEWRAGAGRDREQTVLDTPLSLTTTNQSVEWYGVRLRWTA